MNLSWMDFYDTKMIDWILDDLQQNPTPQNVVRYEITETSYAAIARTDKMFLMNLSREMQKLCLMILAVDTHRLVCCKVTISIY